MAIDVVDEKLVNSVETFVDVLKEYAERCKNGNSNALHEFVDSVLNVEKILSLSANGGWERTGYILFVTIGGPTIYIDTTRTKPLIIGTWADDEYRKVIEDKDIIDFLYAVEDYFDSI